MSGRRQQREVKAAVRRADGSWSAPEAVSPLGEGAYATRVVVDAAGRAVAVWRAPGGALRTAERPAGGAFGPARTLAMLGPYADALRVAGSADGDVVVAWLVTPPRGGAVVRAAVRLPDGQWLAPVDVSGPEASDPLVACPRRTAAP